MSLLGLFLAALIGTATAQTNPVGPCMQGHACNITGGTQTGATYNQATGNFITLTSNPSATDTTSLCAGDGACAAIVGSNRQNTAFGYHALNINNDTASAAFGFQAGLGSTAHALTIFGSNAGSTLDAPGDTIAIGTAAMTNLDDGTLTTGAQNTAIGVHALAHLTSGKFNVGVGNLSMVGCNNWLGCPTNLLTGDGNTGVGYKTLANMFGGATFNTAVGYIAGMALTTGINNTLIGANTGLNNLQTGSNNVIVGANVADTATAITVGAVGIGENVKPGTCDVAIGQFALDATVADSLCNTAIGSNSLTNATTGANNTGVGASSLQNLVGGARNTGIGTQAGLGITSGVNNTLVGMQAGQAISTGSGNTAVGRQALLTATSDNNTALGLNAGDAITTGTKNVIIGQTVGHTLTTGSNNLLIGGTNQTVDAASASTSNQLTIANVIGGTTQSVATPNPSICAIGMSCVLGVLRNANFDTTADNAITIAPLTTSDRGYLSSATKYIITEINVTNCSVSMTTAQGGFYTAASKGGTIIGATTTAYTGCTGATTRQRLTGLTNMDSTVLTGATIYLSLTTIQGVVASGDVYIMGYPIN